MRTTFTPGPWEVGEGLRNSLGVFATTPRGLKKSIAQVGGYGGDSRPANARLMASAPELLAALQDMVARYCDEESLDSPLDEAARAAIERASSACLSGAITETNKS